MRAWIYKHMNHPKSVALDGYGDEGSVGETLCSLCVRGIVDRRSKRDVCMAEVLILSLLEHEHIEALWSGMSWKPKGVKRFTDNVDRWTMLGPPVQLLS